MQNLSKKNKRFLPSLLSIFLGAAILPYPFALYFFKDTASPLYFVYGLLVLLLIRALIPFMIPKKPTTPVQKNTLILTVGVSLIMGALSFFKGNLAAFYYPVVMSLAMGSAFTLSLFFPPSFIERIARLQDPALPPAAIKYTRQVTKIWSGFCLCNATIAYGTIVYGDPEIWTLYNGIISYLLIGLLLGGEILFRAFYKKKQQKRAFENFTSISHLHKKNKETWATYWNSKETICQNYPAYISTLAQTIITSKAQRVFLISEDRAFFLAGFLATLQAGKDLVLPSTHKPDLLKSLMKKGDTILSGQQNLNTLNLPFIDLKKITPNKAGDLQEIDPTKAVLTFYTSGSSGAPTAIKKHLSQLEAEVQELQKTWPMVGQNFSFISTIPHHHLYGLLFSLVWPVCAKIFVARKTISHWNELPPKTAQNNILISSPAHLKRFPEGFSHPFQQVFSSGGPLLMQHVQKSLKVLKILPTEVYGSTETGGIAYRQQTVENTPWTCFQTVHISADKSSNLRVQSPHIKGKNSFQTADRITLYNKVQFSLQGRSDRVVKVEGKRLSLVELEEKLQSMDDIQGAHALLLSLKKRYEIGAVIMLTEVGKRNLKTLGKVLYTRQLRSNLRSYFDLVTLPRRWRFVEFIPENAQGKRPISLLSPLFEKEKEVA